jgi:2'-5' RNA ligase
MPQFRGFIAIDIKPLPKIVDFVNEIKNSGASVKTVELKNIHITLKFLGNTDEEHIEKIGKIMKDSLEGLESFEIELKGAGVFPNMNYMKVMWIGIEPVEILGSIAKKIDDPLSKLGFEREKRKFSVHLTIARIRSAKNKEKLKQILHKYQDVDFGKINVESIKLKKSDLTPKGPIYTTLKNVEIQNEDVK